MTGSGAEVGDVVVDLRRALIAFTGSKEIGLRVNERAGKVHERRMRIKRMVAAVGF